MSLNHSKDSMMASPANGFRDTSGVNQDRNTAYTIYSESSSTHSQSLHAGSSSINERVLSPRQQQLRRELRFSRMRRMFCLLSLFDFLLMAVLWFIYVNLTADASISIHDRLKCEVVDYSLQTSLFDFVVLAVLRSIILLSLYGICRSKHWWTVAVTTTLSCIFLITKVFLYDFGYMNHVKDPCSVPDYTKAHPVDFIIAIISFTMPWVETWILDFQVLPREKKLREALANQEIQDSSVSERTPLLAGEHYPGNSDPIRFYSPEGSQASDVESESDYSESLRSHASDFQSLPNSQRGSSVNLAASIQEQEYLQKAKESLRLMDRILAKHEGWENMANRKEYNAVITSCKMEGLTGKVYKLQTELEVPPEEVVTLLWDKIEGSPSWNPTVLESEVLQQIDDHTDIVYTVSCGGPGNIVAGRDFVVVRNYWQRGDVHVCSSIAVEHSKKPPCSKYVRGFSGPTGWLVEHMENDVNKSKLIWILNTDLNFKVWTPQTIIDKALSHVLMEIGIHLQNKLQELHQSVTTSSTISQPQEIVGSAEPQYVISQDLEKASISSFEDLEEHPPSLDSFGSV